MTGPKLEVQTAALSAVARQLAALSDQLSDAGTVHESSPAVADQPSGQAVVAVTAAVNHMVGECSANLLLFAARIAEAGRAYEATDAAGAGKMAATMPPPR